MSRRLLIVESPTKARTLQRLLGSEWAVRATAGHVKDLPEGRWAIDRGGTFVPAYEILRGKGHVLQKLGKEARVAEEVILATDPDREGEAIAWHVVEELGLEGRARRAWIHELTPSGIDKALAEAGPLDRARYDAQQARRVLDRLVGYSLSPLLSRRIGPGLSAGRVQSAALRLLAQREGERRAFVPSDGRRIEMELLPPKGRPFRAISRSILAEPLTLSLAAQVREEGKLVVQRVASTGRIREAPAPYVTSSLQQDGFSFLRFSATKTMRLAQRLFEGVDLGEAGIVSLITYARTDSNSSSPSAVEAARRYIRQEFGEAAQGTEGMSWGAAPGSQQAHEAIRPLSVDITPALVKPYLDRDAHRLYDRIWRRFVGSQMAPARYQITEIEFSAGGQTFVAADRVVVEKGFLAVWNDRDASRLAGEQELWATTRSLPSLEEGEEIVPGEVSVADCGDLPPARFTEATLLAALEEKGIGRPSTYASIAETLLDRGYVSRQPEGLTVTALGELVDQVLVEAVGDCLAPERTAAVEGALDQIAAGERDWVEVVREFYRPFEERLAAIEKPPSRSRRQTDEICERCGARLAIRWGRTGPFLSCSNYPTCKYTRDLARPGGGGSVVLAAAGIGVGARADAAAERGAVWAAATGGGAPGSMGWPAGEAEAMGGDGLVGRVAEGPLAPAQKGACPRCGAAMVERSGRNGPFLACTGYPACRTAMPLSTGVSCPGCGEGEIAEKRSRAGRLFFGCNRYPACDHTMRERPIPRPCLRCHADFVVQRFSRREGAVFVCIREGCGHHRAVADELDP